MLFFSELIKHIIKLNKICLISLIVLACIFSRTSQNLIKADTLTDVVAIVSDEYDIPEELIRHIIQAESSFNEKAVSYCDARGLMQITRPTWEWITQQYLEVDWDFDQCAFDPEKNIRVGTRFLRWINDYLDQKQELLNGPKQDLVLACYNAGPGNVRKYNYSVPPFKETEDYIKKINNMSKTAYLFARR
ncbi:MAG: lytic transglycosylase domain-containing protein [Candidatus Omnitrophica bacterium]|nr:lytic transglycosylase domain-containing protein [Candidatus Omnitrophota bacterium]